MGVLITTTGEIVETAPLGKVPPFLLKDPGPLTDIKITWGSLTINKQKFRTVEDGLSPVLYLKFKSRWYRIKKEEIQNRTEFADFLDGRGKSFLQQNGIGRIHK